MHPILLAQFLLFLHDRLPQKLHRALLQNQRLVLPLQVLLLNPAIDRLIHVRPSEVGISSIREHFELVSFARNQRKVESSSAEIKHQKNGGIFDKIDVPIVNSGCRGLGKHARHNEASLNGCGANYLFLHTPVGGRDSQNQIFVFLYEFSFDGVLNVRENIRYHFLHSLFDSFTTAFPCYCKLAIGIRYITTKRLLSKFQILIVF